jgi:hypothetical protein
MTAAGVVTPFAGNFCLQQAYITSSSAGFVTGCNTNSGAERLVAIRNRGRAESGLREVSTRWPTQLPRGLRLLLCRPERSRASRRDNPAKRPGFQRSGVRKGNAAAGSERAWQSPSTSSMARCEKRITPLQYKRNLRVKRSDP